MKLTKEQVYINLQGKTKEELTYLWEFLKENNEPTYRDTKKSFLKYANDISCNLYHDGEEWISCEDLFYIKGKTEVTIQQLKQIIKPMGTFAPIAMKCTKEQFDAVKPKLKEIGKIGNLLYAFEDDNIYLVNNYNGEKLFFDISVCYDYNRTSYEEWNEDIFLKACGIEVETLQEKALRLENELNDVNKQIEEESKPKVGDYVYNSKEELFYKKTFEVFNQYERKITNQELIKLLEQEIK